MDKTRKELKKEYQQNHPPMGVYQIRNIADDKVLIGSALNLTGAINSNRFQLNAGSHPNKTLQAEWREFGGDSFAFEIVDELAATEGPGHDYRADLEFLEEFWLEKSQPYGERGYNQKKKGTEERLRLIADNRSRHAEPLTED
ncbi:MAG TPA: GIY-YIG nuclease family protein [Blastocatellia bacterium]|nr:GIY-YIG nuclease family protein [Blastocatellia bacterium]